MTEGASLSLWGSRELLAEVQGQLIYSLQSGIEFISVSFSLVHDLKSPCVHHSQKQPATLLSAATMEVLDSQA
jgi:hypothetical protein